MSYVSTFARKRRKVLLELIDMFADQSEKAEKLVAELGILARAQELGAGEDDIWVLTASVQQAERAFERFTSRFR